MKQEEYIGKGNNINENHLSRIDTAVYTNETYGFEMP